MPKSRLAYILLALFLGGLGIHNFYAGYKGKAIAQLLITVVSLGYLSIISGIWALVDIFIVKQDADGTPFN
ncbi:MAG: NINE protein [Akkermansia sp.]|nr:NINE protein [Akkermansia sp.]